MPRQDSNRGRRRLPGERARRYLTVPVVLLLVVLLAGCAQPALPTPQQPLTPPAVAAGPAAGPSATPRPAILAPPADPTRPVLPTFTPTPGPMARPLQETVNILLLGSDRRGAKGTGRTDVIILLAVDFTRQRIALISIPRDLYVTIPGVGRERINTADVYGELRKPGQGVALVEQTIQQNLGVPVQHYVRIDFEAFVRIINSIGGMTVTVDCPLHEIWSDPAAPGGVVTLDFQPGDQPMDGRTALWYVRTRRRGNDLDRARRQQRVLLALKNRAEEVNLLPRVPELFTALRDNVDTDLSLLDVLALARLGLEIRPSDIHSRVFDFQMARPYTTSGGAAVLMPNQDAIRTALDAIWDAPDVLTSTDHSQRCP